MISVVDKYFSLNRILLLILGLWPYNKSKYVQLQLICIFSILISSILFQLTTFLTSKCTMEFIIKILSFATSISSCVIIYNSFYVNGESVKYLTEQIQHIYNNVKDSNEIAIVERYGSKAKYFTAIFTLAFFSGAFIIVLVQLWPDFIHIVLSVNVSRSRHLQISTEYFIDQEKYFYVLFFHMNATIVIATFILAATGLTLFTYLYHACGMFKIASYRIEKAMQIYIPKSINAQNKILAYKGIIRAVDIHRKAIIFSHYLISRFEISFMFLIAFGVLTLALNIFRVFQVALHSYNTEELLINLICASSSVLYMFLANLIGQLIIDHNNYIFASAYNARWYVTPLHIQKLILFLLKRGNKSFGLCVGGLFIASIECFATLVNAAVSYFTIIYSMQ